MASTKIPGIRSARGLSLVELMVALAVGLVLLFGMATIYANASRSHRQLVNSAQHIDSANYAGLMVSTELRHAGYYGDYFNQAAYPGAFPDPCETGNLANLRAALAAPIQGYNAPGASPLACLPAANHLPGTDILVMRSVATGATALGSLVANELYVQSNADYNDPANPILAAGTAGNFTLVKRDGVTTADVRKFLVRILYVSPCNLPRPGSTTCDAQADGGRPVPTLKILELGLDPNTGNLGMVSIPVAEGVENLQLDYGMDADGDGVAEGNFVSAPATVADWANVVAVRLYLLVRNAETTPGYTDTKIYNLGTTGNVTPGGAFKRHLYTQLVRLTNVAQLRETP